MQLIKSKPSHWYEFRNGEFLPCYQLPKKDGNGVKKPTLREAKELGLLPSVTTFLAILDKPELDNWKQEKAIHAALTLPRKAGESEDEFAVRVVEDMEAESEKAIGFGQDIHAAIEAYLSGQPLLETDPLWPFLKSFTEWAKDEIVDVIASEKIVGSRQWGYAGRLDLHCKLKGIGEAVCDFKTSRIKKQPVVYPEFGLQLAAYNQCLKPEKKRALVNIIIDSGKPAPIYCHQWDNPDQLWSMCLHTFELWKFLKGYDPSKTAS